jgi:hypothetical protein
VTAPYLVACLVELRAEFNALDPDRKHASDGWIGDAAHQREHSDHNPDAQGRVLALDVDSSGPWPAPFADIVESIRGDARLEYVIYNRRIATRSAGWSWRAYDGTDPHTGHAHFSARHDHFGQNSTSTWNLEDFMPLTPGDKAFIKDTVDALITAVPLTGPDGKPDGTISTPVGHFALSQGIPRSADPDHNGRAAAYVVIGEIGSKLDAILAKLDALTPPA